MLAFCGTIEAVGEFTIEDAGLDSVEMCRIRAFVAALEAEGGTAIYGSLAAAYQMAADAQADDPNRYYSIVLMSDGEKTEGAELSEFRRFYASLPTEIQRIRTFPVLFGDANRKAMQEIADLTGGRVFDGAQESLSTIFKEIRGYQ
jgi:Ca-activated chloride channel family protein